MREGHKSRTAEATAAVRAAHLLHERPVVFGDAFAIHLTSPGWRFLCRSRLLNRLIMGRLLGALRPVGAQVLGRSRYAEDSLEKALASGIDQYVLIGAGLDSFALRRQDLADKLSVYELDHPASQQSKRDRLAQLGIVPPGNLEFLAVDFESDSIADTLERSSCSRERRIFFSWLGTTVYLTRRAVFHTLDSIASFAAPGSEIVFDYAIPSEGLDSATDSKNKKLKRFTARRGEPLKTFFEPETFTQEVCALGFELVEDLSPEEQKKRYFCGRADGLSPSLSSHFSHFRVTGKATPPPLEARLSR